MGCWLQGQTCPCGWCFLRQLWVSSRGGSSSLGCGSPVGTGVDALCGICGSALRSESPVGTDVGSLAGAVGLDPAVGCLRQQEQVLGCAGPLGSVVSQPLTQGDGSGVPVSHLLAYLYVGSAAGPGPEASEPRPAMTMWLIFCSQIRPRPTSAQICQRAWGKPQAEGCCVHSPSRPASSDKAC